MAHLTEMIEELKVTYNYHLSKEDDHVIKIELTEEDAEDSVLLENKIKEVIQSIENPSRVSKLQFENIPDRFPFEELSRFEDLVTLSVSNCFLTNRIEDIEEIARQLKGLLVVDLTGNTHIEGTLDENSPLRKLEYLSTEGTSVRIGEGLRKKITIVRDN